MFVKLKSIEATFGSAKISFDRILVLVLHLLDGGNHMANSERHRAGPVLEVCVDDTEGLSQALIGGAERIELCAALALGGLTPSPGLIEAARQAPVPVFAMIRPRAGDFCYTEADLRTAETEIAAIRAAGLSGVVLGATTPQGGLDISALARFKAACAGLPMVLHRAIDVVSDTDAALDHAIELGFCRVLTSGGAPRAIDGCDTLRQMAKRAAGRITIMAGGGVCAENAADLLATGIDDLHGSCSVPHTQTSDLSALGLAPSRAVTSAAKVRALRDAMARTPEAAL